MVDASMKDQIAKEMTEQIFEAYPYLWDKFGEAGYERTLEDNHHHLDHLETAFKMNDIQLFIHYTEWLNEILTTRNVGTALIVDNFERLLKGIHGTLDSEREAAYTSFLQAALTTLQTKGNEGGRADD